MDQLAELNRDRRQRKSISEVREQPRQMSPLKLSLLPDNPMDGVLYNREFKRSIIKINKKKLPVDFFSSELPDSQHRLNLERKASVNREQRIPYPATQRKTHVDRLIEQLENPDQAIESSADDRFKGTSFFGGVTSLVGPQFRRENMHLKDTDEGRKMQRNYQTRSEEKREKPFLQQRKFTAVGASNKPDSLDLFPYSKDKPEGDIGDMVVFNGTFAKEMRDQSGRLSAMKESAVISKDRVERKLDFEAIKLETMNIKASVIERRQVDPSSLLSSMRRQKDHPEPDSPVRQLGSPGIKRPANSSPSKKQPISPVKIIVTNPDPRRVQGTPQNGPSAGGQFFDVTFYNTKSSVLPPIGK